MAAMSKEDVLPPWGLALAGSAGAVLANILVYPLDIVKTRLQVQVKKQHNQPAVAGDSGDHHYESTMHAIATIMEHEGISGLYSGMPSALLGVASTNYAYFYWYSAVRTMYLSYQTVPATPSTAIELSLGAVAGALAQLFTIPIAVVTTRQQTQRKHERKGLVDTAKEIIDSEDGYAGLWRGLKASLVLVINPSITYGAYQRLRTLLFPDVLNLAPWQAFLLGAMSKALATIVTQPLIVAKVRLQSRPPPDRNGRPFRSFGEVLSYTVKHEGAPSLFKGLAPQLTKGILVQGFLMMTKERVELLFMLLFKYVRQLRKDKIEKLAALAAEKAQEAAPALMKQATPVLGK